MRAIAAAGDAASFRSWGIVKIRWRVLVLGEREAVLGDREVVQWTDAMRSERERLQFADGRTFLRRGGKVEAERHGMPWPTLEPQATREIEFFAAQAGFPWRLLDAERYVEESDEIAHSSAPDLWRVRLVAMPASGVMGPSPAPTPARDAVEIVVAAASASTTGGRIGLRAGSPHHSVDRLARRARPEDPLPTDLPRRSWAPGVTAADRGDRSRHPA